MIETCLASPCLQIGTQVPSWVSGALLSFCHWGPAVVQLVGTDEWGPVGPCPLQKQLELLAREEPGMLAF